MVYSINTDEASFEELIDLKAEVDEIKLMPEHESLVSSKQVVAIADVTMLTASKIKGWLFNYYLILGDYDRYEQVNARMKSYLKKVKYSISSKEIDFRNSILIQRWNQEKF